MGPSIVVQGIGSQVLGCPKDAQGAPSGLAFPTEILNIMQVPPSPALVGPELPSLPCLMFETVQMTPPGGHDGLKRTEIVQDPPSWPHVEQEGAQGPPVMPHVGREKVQVPPRWPHAGQKNAQSSPFEVQFATKNAKIVQGILSKTPLEHKNTSENVVPPRGGENSFLGTDAMSEMPRLLPLSSGETPENSVEMFAMASEKEKMLKLSTAEAKRSWRAEVLGPENVNLTAGSLSPLPPAPEGWHEPQNPARLPGNSAGQPPHGSRGIASQIESFQTEMHNLTSTQRTQGSPSPQESPILLGDAKKRQMTPASSVSSAGGKYQRVESADPPAPSQDDVSMGSGPSQTFEGEGQIVAPPLPGQSSTGQRDPWKSWFDAHFHDAIQVHQRTYQNFHEKLLKTVTDYHQEFQRSIGTKLLSGLDRVAADLGGQHSEEKRQLFETISGAISVSTQSLAQECRQLIDIQNAEMRTRIACGGERRGDCPCQKVGRRMRSKFHQIFSSH
jgi:hypothetical protein